MASETLKVPVDFLIQSPCPDCRGLGFHEHNVEGDAFDIVNCSTCKGDGLINQWRRK